MAYHVGEEKIKSIADRALVEKVYKDLSAIGKDPYGSMRFDSHGYIDDINPDCEKSFKLALQKLKNKYTDIEFKVLHDNEMVMFRTKGSVGWYPIYHGWFTGSKT